MATNFWELGDIKQAGKEDTRDERDGKQGEHARELPANVRVEEVKEERDWENALEDYIYFIGFLLPVCCYILCT